LAASQAALKKELVTEAQENKHQLARQTSLLKQTEAQLSTELSAEHAAVAQARTAAQALEARLQREYTDKLAEAQAALKKECATEVEEHKKQLAQVWVSSLAFGAKAWGQYFGEVGQEPYLPSEIGQILNRTCPFWPGKQIKDTHLLVLMPSRVDKQFFTLDLRGRLMQKPKAGSYSTKYRYHSDDVQHVLGDQSSDNAY
jgi:exonuclease VII large subunit